MPTEKQRTWNYNPVTYLPPAYKQSKLTGPQRDEIRARVADGENIADLATEYGVSARTIRHYAA